MSAVTWWDGWQAGLLIITLGGAALLIAAAVICAWLQMPRRNRYKRRRSDNE